jgi:hypothetical protein
MSDENHLATWLQFQLEQNNHGRHHELLRSQSTNLVVVVSAALLAFMSSQAGSSHTLWALSALLVVLNTYGFVMSLKHYERSHLHYSVARAYADRISGVSPLDGANLNVTRAEVHSSHEQHFSLVHRIRANWLWACLHLLIAVIGVILAI